MSAHQYLSTACHHELHERCRGTCKFCEVMCSCSCHIPKPGPSPSGANAPASRVVDGGDGGTRRGCNNETCVETVSWEGDGWCDPHRPKLAAGEGRAPAPQLDYRRRILDVLERDLSPWTFNGTEPMCVELFAVIEAELAALQSAQPEPEKGWQPYELTLRKVWWINHGCSLAILYGDDGEMQCNDLSHGAIDFKRMPLAELAMTLTTAGSLHAGKVSSLPSATQEPK